MEQVHNAYAKAGADLIKTNTFGAMPWVLDEYGMGDRAYELSKKGGRDCSKDLWRTTPPLEKPVIWSPGSFGARGQIPFLGAYFLMMGLLRGFLNLLGG